ncbi:psaD, partial [Symbiodinium pilosum]
MSSMPRSVALVGVGAALMACTAFVAPSAGQNRLRARVQPQADFGASAPSAGASGLWTACSMGGVLLAVGAAVTRRAESKEIEQAKFEMPTGGYAIMNKGENLCYFRKKEQCIALGKQLRKMKIENYKIYRLKKDGTVIFMHPADGVFPEKVNKGRRQVNGRPFTICSNPQQSELKFTKYKEKARVMAFADIPNLFALPQPNMDELVPVEEAEKYSRQEYTTKMMEALKRVQEDRAAKEAKSL